jgi:conjugal transfer pilus assembly protein TraW
MGLEYRKYHLSDGITIPALVCAFVLLQILQPANTLPADLGVVGKTYPMLERDVSEEIRARIGRIDWKEVLSRSGLGEKARRFKPYGLKELPRAGQDTNRLVSVEYTLDMDIPDSRGNVLYPRGYTFNPLDYMSYSKTMVVFNGDDDKQVAWFRKSPYLKKVDVIVLITGGDYLTLSADLGQPVYFLDTRIAEKLQLRAIPSIIRQMNRFMEVREIKVDYEDDIVSHK